MLQDFSLVYFPTGSESVPLIRLCEIWKVSWNRGSKVIIFASHPNIQQFCNFLIQFQDPEKYIVKHQ